MLPFSLFQDISGRTTKIKTMRVKHETNSSMYQLWGLVLTMGLIQAKNLDKVRIGYVAEPAHGLFFLAQEKGFFKEQGIEAAAP